MRSLFGFIALLLIGICAGTTFTALDTEARARRWDKVANSADRARETHRDFLRAQEYSSDLMEAVRMLASENGILCERDLMAMGVVAEFEDENRRLKTVVAESIDRMQDQEEQINELIDQNGRFSYKVGVLEATIETLEAAIQSLENSAPSEGPVSALPVNQTVASVTLVKVATKILFILF